jgi:FAD/FMN-containing dehydrogenase
MRETMRETRPSGTAQSVSTAARQAHDGKVSAIAARVRDLIGRGQPVHIHKGGVHHVVPIPGDKRFQSRPIDVSSLRQILAIDTEARTATCEPGVTFGELARATLKQGLLPTVVPELEGITVGGAVAGCSVESMSYQYGGFHDSALEYELVTGAGEILGLSPDHEADLFHRVHGSYGTLGILTLLTVRLIPAKPFVRMEYRRFSDAESFHTELLARSKAADFDFVDGIVHGPREYVACLGRFVDRAPRVSSYRWLDIFYKSTQRLREDYLSTVDYCFRYDTECHWLTKTVPPLEWKPVRLLVGKTFLGSENLIRWSKRLEPVLGLKKRPDVVVDVFIPASRVPEFYRWYERDFHFYPLWVVPYRIPKMYPWVDPAFAQKMGDELFFDLAVYGKPNNDPHVDWSQVLEEKTYELGGIKTLISRNHYSEERFWTIYDRPGYLAAKKRTDPGAVFPNVYDKFHRVE